MVYRELLPKLRISSPGSSLLPGILLPANGSTIYPAAQIRKVRVTISPSLSLLHIVSNRSPRLTLRSARFSPSSVTLVHVTVTFSPELRQGLPNWCARSLNPSPSLFSMLQPEWSSQFLPRSPAYWKPSLLVPLGISPTSPARPDLRASPASSYTQSRLSHALPASPLSAFLKPLLLFPSSCPGIFTHALPSPPCLVNSHSPQV